MRITLDTNILVTANGHYGPGRELLNRIIVGRHDLILSQVILYELEEVSYYPRIRRLMGMSAAEVSRYIERLAKISDLVDIGAPTPLPLHDFDDWMGLRTAIAGKVDILCSNDRDLHHPSLAPLYRQAGITALTADELLTRLR